jgi:PRTRC genetic system protein F
MRKCNRQIGSLKPASTPGRPDAAPTGCAASVFLALPALSIQVPIRSVTEEGRAQWIQAATFCAELVGDDELVINKKTTARDIVSQALSAWASKHCADINLLDKFSMTASFDPDAYGVENDGTCLNSQGRPHGNDFYIGFESQECTPFIYVKNKLDALEKDYPQLARTVIHFAELASYRTFTAFSPNVGLHQGSHLYWYGADTDDEFQSLKDENGDDDDEDSEDTFLPSQYIADFPEYFFTGEALDRDALLRIEAESNEVAEVVQVILSIMDLIDQDAGFSSMDSFYCESAYFSCYMGSDRESNMLGRVVDDFYANTSSGEFTAMYGVATIPFNIESFLKWRDEMEKGFALYSKLDRLMILINE